MESHLGPFFIPNSSFIILHLFGAILVAKPIWGFAPDTRKRKSANPPRLPRGFADSEAYPSEE
jgi:hypothetical protein